MTPAQRIDREEFERDSADALQRALAYAKAKREAERNRVLKFIHGKAPAGNFSSNIKNSLGVFGRPARQYTVNGLTMSIDMWARHLGLTSSALLARKKRLGSYEAAIKAGSERLPNRVAQRITYNGQSLTIREWAEQLGVQTATIYRRMNSGHSPVEAIAMGVRKPANANDNTAPGVVSNFPASQGTGAGSTLQETPEITFSEKAKSQ
ncbi:hypothetical protein [Phyllobacterium zundukense]|uniref:Uncharacterized protein n=1 Tax=Phyllobacterium zundukense TaxID=1867719 RepID=A0A2N9W450_9HYPH|nr:hypothetical protein [Phyllobacterium zundukense]ATU92012.1 hypothetical protein BLM14_10495 [Phyllobacterium zundukense]PIO46518.1 hypothetical protein B5P45_01585 [Phyllobacterium zundukense]